MKGLGESMLPAGTGRGKSLGGLAGVEEHPAERVGITSRSRPVFWGRNCGSQLPSPGTTGTGQPMTSKWPSPAAEAQPGQPEHGAGRR